MTLNEASSKLKDVGGKKILIMADLKISGRTKVDSFYKKFENMYPYLNPALFYPGYWRRRG